MDPTDASGRGAALVADILDRPKKKLKHHGILGQKWGVRRSRGPGGTVSSSEDAKKAAEAQAKLKKGGVQSLENDEIRDLLTRMRLERDYASLTSTESSKIEKGQKKVEKILSVGRTVNDVIRFADTAAARLLADKLGPSAVTKQQKIAAYNQKPGGGKKGKKNK